MDFTVENLCSLLRRSRLVTLDEVHAIYDRSSAEAQGNAASPAHFTRWLVEQNLVTDYQASLLAKGMVDDFFLGEYTILERVGRGRMAGVYKARHLDGRIVAIKVLPPSRTKIPTLMARFQREATLARAFDHPNVVRSLDVGEMNGVHFIVMEFLDGETVDDVLQRRKRLPPSEAVGIVHQALLGLQHLHEHGVVHRDLKPANLMLVSSLQSGQPDSTLGRTVKILDIGLARKIFEEQIPAEKIDPTEVTREGVLLGTPDYLSPEQARDPRAIDIRSDIYSLGCVLYHLLTGSTPFPESNFLTLMLRHATEKPRPLSDFVPNIPDGLQQILNYMTAKQADQRYPTPARAANALEVFLLADGSEPATASADAPPHPSGATTIDAALPPVAKPSLAKKSSSDRIPTAKALKKSGKYAAIARNAPLGMPYAPPPQLPDNIELVPLDPPAAPSPFAPPVDDGLVIVTPPRRPRIDRLLLAIGAGIVTLVVAIAAVLALILRR